MIDPASIPEYPTFRDDLAGRPLRHYLAKYNHHVGALELDDWSSWQTILARCYGQALQLDAAIGDLLAALDATGAGENTLVVWLADHGDAVASHGGIWDKDSTFIEEVARVPMAVRWPAALEGGGRSNALVSNMDATATILEAAGVPVPDDMDSRSVLPLCRGGADWPDHLICEHYGHGGGGRILQRIILQWPYKYVAALYDGDEMYDLEADPYEVNNLVNSAEHEAARQELRRRLLEHVRREKGMETRRLALSLERGF
jgi:arylsulfatase A-like enzyme